MITTKMHLDGGYSRAFSAADQQKGMTAAVPARQRAALSIFGALAAGVAFGVEGAPLGRTGDRMG